VQSQLQANAHFQVDMSLGRTIGAQSRRHIARRATERGAPAKHQLQVKETKHRNQLQLQARARCRVDMSLGLTIGADTRRQIAWAALAHGASSQAA